MALWPWTSLICQATFVSKVRWNSQVSLQGQATDMCWMSFWSHNKKTMKDTTIPKWRQTYFQGYEIRWLCVYWSNDQNTGWVHWSTESNAHYKRYRAATIFVDHFSRLWYVHLMTDKTSEGTVMAKKAFEHFAESHAVHIQHYHCDNSHFADNAFIASSEQNKWHITCCGVNVHFQNGIAEWAIRDIQEQAWKQLLHARARWPEVMHSALWPYAVRYAIYIHNTVPFQDDVLDWNSLQESDVEQKWKKTTPSTVLFLPSKIIYREVIQF